MPEIGEVARIVHYLRKHLVGRTIATCTAQRDDIVYGKVHCSAAAFQSHVTGRRVTGAAQQGKYFYITFDRAPHSVLHFGMSGWMKFDVEDTHYYRPKDEGKKAGEEWPPKYMKFLLRCEKETVDGVERGPVEVAFVDPRRLGRIRLVECEEEEIRNVSPLKENGPDPVRDSETVTVEWLTALLRKKRVPVKALMLDQANLSGIGNWVGDEICYQARIHPEQYSNTLDDAQIKRLHDSMMFVCKTAVDTLGESEDFPQDWLMLHRWNKGKKGANTLPNGDKIEHLTVGGRTSAIVPSVQKKTAAVSGDVAGADGEEKVKKAAPKKRKVKTAVKDEDEGEEEKEEEEKPAKKSRASNAKSNGVKEREEKPPTPGSRRSVRTKAR